MTSRHYLLLVFAYSPPPKGCGFIHNIWLHRWLKDYDNSSCRVRQWKQKMMSEDCQQAFGHCQMACSFPQGTFRMQQNQITLLLGKKNRLNLLLFSLLLLTWTGLQRVMKTSTILLALLRWRALARVWKRNSISKKMSPQPWRILE